MPAWRTSETHPLQIATVAAPLGGKRGGGAVGVTFCPGKTDGGALTGAWRRSLDMDIAAIKAWGAEALVCLIEAHEFEFLKVPGLEAAVRAAGIAWVHLPIVDVGTPTRGFERRWAAEGPALRAALARGGRVLVHCRGGLGRSGMIAARLLVELGTAPDDAIAAVRAVRPGAIETRAQEDHVRRLRPLPAGT